MLIFQLGEEIDFPPVELATDIGILAIGGDLSPERLLMAYKSGIFPWYSEGEPILWWSPDPRFVLFPGELRISRSMRKVLKKNIFRVTFDREFREVIIGCSQPRIKQRGTWITDEMIEAYCELHRLGYAHSVEVWKDGDFAGGLYGVSLGRCFFAESMFTRVSNASKAALITLTRKLGERGFFMIDCQVYTRHVETFGAREIPRSAFRKILDSALQYETYLGNWGDAELFG